uniref:Uncharacterized protein n=1 Tax=Manihot esculenta TaxID=3983 RepID=A0A2C9UQ78_MANES
MIVSASASNGSCPFSPLGSFSFPTSLSTEAHFACKNQFYLLIPLNPTPLSFVFCYSKKALLKVSILLLNRS